MYEIHHNSTIEDLFRKKYLGFITHFSQRLLHGLMVS